MVEVFWRAAVLLVLALSERARYHQVFCELPGRTQIHIPITIWRINRGFHCTTTAVPF